MNSLLEAPVLVTGAAGGIGAACVQAFVRSGARVVATDIVPEVFSLEQQHGSDRCRARVCDLLQEADVAELIQFAVNCFGSLYALVNSAAVLWPASPLHETTNEQFEDLVGVNVRGLFFLCRHAFPQLRSTRGCIVNVSSMAGIHGEKHHALYSATKGAINALTMSMALDYGEYGIRVNAVCPSSVLTPNVDRAITTLGNAQEIVELRKRNNPLGYTAQPAEVASAVVFLASPEASYVSGILLPVSAGSHCGYGIKY